MQIHDALSDARPLAFRTFTAMRLQQPVRVSPLRSLMCPVNTSHSYTHPNNQRCSLVYIAFFSFSTFVLRVPRELVHVGW
ncbi:hypothetical protein K458DRAFT_196944 [Lentithecium fluviatile CBS 122367]|uniref:Uncharacterized protein n=1 Tax=Lentithecium fluviatile CBS 122367 TaxID=1168545 RepID=A0A6G1ID14_9PLEO|nr:hypothetical protein K458DRAFT_196944 [Lentithecium fluviatile CBS 122367]